MSDNESGESQNEGHKQNIDQYLKQLKKRVEHQVKNPFNLPFLNYSFEELSTWKSNITQLDATSKLYGMRVDFLHTGVVDIVNSVMRKGEEDLIVEQIRDQKKGGNQKQPMLENSETFFLENAEKLNNQVEITFKNPLLWERLCRKCDSIEQLMLNCLPMQNDFSFNTILSNQSFQEPSRFIQCQSFAEFTKSNLNKSNVLMIFEEISQFKKELEQYSLHSSQNKALKPLKTFNLDVQLGNFDMEFSLFTNQNQNISIEFGQNEQINPEDKNDLLQIDLHEIEEKQKQQSIEESSDSNQQYDKDYDPTHKMLFKQKEIKLKSKRKTSKSKKYKERHQKIQELDVSFNSFRQCKYTVFDFSQKQFNVNFHKNLMPKDISIIYHRNPFKIRKQQKSKAKLNVRPFKVINEGDNPNLQAMNPQIEFNAGLQTCTLTLTNLAKREKQVSLKFLKGKIRQQIYQLKQDVSLSILQQTINIPDPLDLFTAMLHIAAENQLYLQRKEMTFSSLLLSSVND